GLTKGFVLALPKGYVRPCLLEPPFLAHLETESYSSPCTFSLLLMVLSDFYLEPHFASISVVNGAKFAFEYSAAESQSKSTECFVGGVKVFSWVLSAQF
ncbi:hypothetical protein OFN51_24560, partial [Escherichia coli]|nr:hypothetical protein [Escherichia coli]